MLLLSFQPGVAGAHRAPSVAGTCLCNGPLYAKHTTNNNKLTNVKRLLLLVDQLAEMLLLLLAELAIGSRLLRLVRLCSRGAAEPAKPATTGSLGCSCCSFALVTLNLLQYKVQLIIRAKALLCMIGQDQGASVSTDIQVSPA